MALAAIERGYEYLAITDHSHYLREGRMEAQDREIDAVNKKLAPFRLLKGVEVNIRADGSLDVPDEVLAERDWVVASIHSAFHRDPTDRLCGAMENPHVDSIGHLTGRKIGRREGMAIDPGVSWRRRRERAPHSRSTPSPTASTCRIPSRGSRARKGSWFR